MEYFLVHKICNGDFNDFGEKKEDEKIQSIKENGLCSSKYLTNNKIDKREK